MKKLKLIPILIIVFILSLMTVVACNKENKDEIVFKNEASDIIDVTAGEYNSESQATVGELPDEAGAKIDGVLDEDMWTKATRKWMSHKDTISGASIQVTTHLSNKGLYIAAKTDDKNIMWNGKNYINWNSHFVFRIAQDGTTTYSGKVKEVIIDTNNVYPGTTRINAATKVFGEPVNTGNSSGWSVEMFATWDDLKIGIPETNADGSISYKKPDNVLLYWRYRYVDSNRGINAAGRDVRNTFDYDAALMSNYTSMNAYGYVAADRQDAKLGNAKTGVSKSAGWDVKNVNGELEDDKTTFKPDSESVKTTMAKYQGIFFTDADSERFIATTRLKWLSDTTRNTGPKAGIVSYLDNVNYRAILLDLGSDNRDTNSNIMKDKLFAITHAPDNKYNMSPLVPDGNNTEVDKKEDGTPLYDKITVIKDRHNFYYLVNDKLVYSEVVTYLSGNVAVGLYSAEAKVEFKDYEFTDFQGADKDAAFTEACAEYFYAVGAEVNTGAGGTFTAESLAVTSSAADDRNMKFTISLKSGYKLDKITMTNASNPDGIAVWTPSATTGTMVGNVFTHQVNEDSSFKAEFVKLTDEETVTIAIKAHKIGDEKLRVESAKIIVTAYDENNNLINGYQVEHIATVRGEATLKLMKGYKLYFDVEGSGFRKWTGFCTPIPEDATEQQIEDLRTNGVILTEGIEDDRATKDVFEGYVIEADINRVGGSVRNPGPEEEGGMKDSFALSSVTSVWDMSLEYDSKIIFHDNTPNSSPVYFTDVYDTFAVVEATISNITDSKIYSDYEPDPAAGIIIADGIKRTFIGLRQRGLRILTTYVWDDGRVEATNLVTYDTVNKPDGASSTTLKVVRANAMYFVYINDVHVYTHTDANFIAYDNEGSYHKATAYGFAVTTSFPLTMQYSDYSCMVGQDARDYVKQYHQTEINLTGDAKAITSFSSEISTEGEGENAKLVTVKNSKFDIELNAAEGKAYEVRISSEGANDDVYLMTAENNTIEVEARIEAVTNVAVNEVSGVAVRTVTGKLDAGEQALKRPVLTATRMATGATKQIAVDVTDGSFEAILTDGEYKFSAGATDFYLSETTFTIAENAVVVPDIEMKKALFGGSIVVDGKRWNSVSGLDSADKGYHYPGRFNNNNNNFTLYVNGEGANPVGTEYLFGFTTRINTKNVNSAYYANDNVQGLCVVNNEKQLNILVFNAGFRIMVGGWNNTHMIETSGTGWNFWSDDYGMGVNEYAEVTVTGYRRDNVIYVYVESARRERTLYLTVDPVNGVKTYGNNGNHKVTTGTAGRMSAFKTEIKNIFYATDGVTQKNNGLGYNAQMNHAVASNTNASVVRDAFYSTDPADIDAFIATAFEVVNDAEKGSVSFSGEGYVFADDTNKFINGKDITITVTANDGYVVSAIKVNGVGQSIEVGQDNTASVTVTPGTEFSVEVVYADATIERFEVKLDAARSIRNNTVKIMGSKDGAAAVEVEYVPGSDNKFAVNVEAGEWIFTAYNSADEAIGTATVTVADGGANTGTFNAV